MDRSTEKITSYTELRHRTPVKVRILGSKEQDDQTKQKKKYQLIQSQYKSIILNLEIRLRMANEQHQRTKRDLENKIKILTKQKTLLEYALAKTKENTSNIQKENINFNGNTRNLVENIRGFDTGYKTENFKNYIPDTYMEMISIRDEIDRLKKDNMQLAKIDDEKTKEVEKLKLEISHLRVNVHNLKRQIDIKSNTIGQYEIKERSRSNSRQKAKSEKPPLSPDNGHHHRYHAKIDINAQNQIKQLQLQLARANYKNKGLVKTIDAMNQEFMRKNMVFLNNRIWEQY